jgi:hypothetical protein
VGTLGTLAVGSLAGAVATASVTLAAASGAVGAGAGDVSVTSGAGATGGEAVGAAVGMADAALHPARSTTTAARPNLINRDTQREIKAHQPTRAN